MLRPRPLLIKTNLSPADSSVAPRTQEALKAAAVFIK